MKTTRDATTLTGNGSSYAVVHEVNASGPDVRAIAGLSGTFTGATAVVEGKLYGGSIWYPLLMQDRKTGVRTFGSAAVSDSTATAWDVYCAGMQFIRLYTSGGTQTADAVEITSGTAEDFGGSDLGGVTVNNSSTSTFGAGVSFSGGTGVNLLSVPDNLADAFSIVEGSNAYVTVVTTNGSEAVSLRQDVAIIGGKDLTFVGTTGQSQVNLTDNLADALSVKVLGGNDLLVLKTTDSAETLFLGSGGSQFVFNRTGMPVASGLVNKATITTAGAGTYTAANILGGLILRDPNGSGRTDTTHTAAQLVAALPGVAVDDVFDVMIVNTADAAETITLQGGSGVTLVPATVTIAQNEIFIGKVRFTNVTGSSEAVTIYGGNVAG